MRMCTWTCVRTYVHTRAHCTYCAGACARMRWYGKCENAYVATATVVHQSERMEATSLPGQGSTATTRSRTESGQTAGLTYRRGTFVIIIYAAV